MEGFRGDRCLPGQPIGELDGDVRLGLGQLLRREHAFGPADDRRKAERALGGQLVILALESGQPSCSLFRGEVLVLLDERAGQRQPSQREVNPRLVGLLLRNQCRYVRVQLRSLLRCQSVQFLHQLDLDV